MHACQYEQIRLSVVGDEMKLFLRHLLLVRLQLSKDTDMDQGLWAQPDFRNPGFGIAAGNIFSILESGIERYGKRGPH